MSKPPAPASPTPQPVSSLPPLLRHHWPLWIGGIAMALTVVALVVVFVARQPGGMPSPRGAIARLLIPEAHAGDAFALIAESADAAGAAVDTSFNVISKVPVTAEELKTALQIDPPVAVSVDDLGNGSFRVRPSEPLASGEVYRLAVNTAVEHADGSRVARDFSWAIQTKDIFHVMSSVPGDGSSGVPLDTGIEVTMSQVGWEDPSAVFSISPEVKGNFERHGRSLAFIPSKPLQPGILYTVTFKAGWKVKDSDLALLQDKVIRFETISASAVEFGKRIVRIEPAGTLFETAPNKEAFIQAYLSDSESFAKNVDVAGFSLSKPDAVTLVTDLEKTPWWARETRLRGDAFQPFAKTEAFRVQAALEGDGYPNYLRLPGVAAGIYAVRITPSVAAGATAEPTWFVLQVTDVATYSMSDERTTLIWAMNASTLRPLTGATVRLKDATVTTGDDGIARLPTPSELTSTSTDPVGVIADVSSGPLTALVPLEGNGRAIPFEYGWSGTPNAHDSTWGYVFTDRPLYRVQDTISFFGLAQDRDTQRAAGNLTAVLKRQGFIWLGGYREKTFAETTVTPDEFGFIRGELRWDALTPGYYSVTVLRDGKEVMSRGIEVRDVVKPAYTIDVLPKSAAIYGGDALEGQVKVTLFDGSPMARQKIKVRAYGSYDNEEMTVETDDSGFANYRFVTKRQACNLKETYAYCSSAWTDTVSAEPVDAEEAYIRGSAFVTVWAARISTTVETNVKDEMATLSFFTRRVDLTNAAGRDSSSVLADAVRGIPLTGRVLEQEWKKFEDGTIYDYIEKKVVPRYRYELVETEVAPITLTTDGSGRATMTVPVRDKMSYRVVVTGTDEAGATDSLVTTFAKGWVENGYAQDQSIFLGVTNKDDENRSYGVGEEVSVRFYRAGEPLPDADTPNFLYVETSRGIRNASVTNRAVYSFRYRDDLVPNMTLYGVSFGANGFVETNFWATFDSAPRKLNLTVTTDKESYAPGANVTAMVDVRTADGAPVRNARVALAAVDEALMAAASGEYQESPIDTLYQGVGNGILQTRSSHAALTERFGPGGAEFGGGGSEPVRRNFKDTAAFDVLTTDGGGRATLEFTVPDNITTWRLTAVAMTGDRSAGASRGKAVVTKPVFVDAVIPQTLLVSDKPVLKLRAFGTGLRAGEQITMTLDAKTLGLDGRTVTSTAGTPVFLPLDQLNEGNHALIVRVRASGGTDAIERILRVLPSRFTHDESVTTDLAPGVALPETGVAADMDVSFIPLGRAKYLGHVEWLAMPWSARLEAKVAGHLMTQLLRDAYGKTDVDAPSPLLSYQLSSGGLAPLPYASEDVMLSAKVAAIDPGAFDRGTLANYFWTIADNERVTREEGIAALSGLAALREPVLPRVQALVETTDLGWRERLSLIRALDAAGDRERARNLLEGMLKDAVTVDGLVHLPVAEDQRSVIEATAEAAALAANMGFPQAAGMDAYLSANWNRDAMTDLDRAAYLAKIVPTLLAGDVTIRYAVNGKESTTTLKDGATETVTLTSSEAKSFRTISVDGPAAVVFTRRIPGRMPTSSDVSLTRSYQVEGRNISLDIQQNDVVSITLQPAWKNTAQDGCYVVRDRLPSGLAPLVTYFFDPYARQEVMSYPFDVANGEVSFVTCKGITQPIRYRARVVSRGTYTAEAASLQSMDAPSVAALSSDTTVTIK
jgi:hypothetical protein